MGKDLIHKRCLGDKARYADLLNGLLFGGRQEILPDDVEVFQSDLKQIFDFIRYSGDKRKLRWLVENNPAYQEMDEDAYDMVMAYTNNTELVAKKEMYRKAEKLVRRFGISAEQAEEYLVKLWQ